MRRLAPAPVGPQCLEQRRAQRQIAVLAALAFDHVDDHALAVDVGELQPRNFAAAHAGAVENHQQGAPNRLVLASISRATSSLLRMLGSIADAPLG